MSEENGSEAALLDQIQLLSSEALDSEEVANEEPIVEEHVEHEEQAFEDPGTPLENEYSAEVEEDSEDEDDFKIIIDDTRTNVTFRAPGGVQRGAVVGGVGKTTQKLDIDATAMINGAPLYDLDLASLEEKPWRKPGADVTDYFNYGFTEDTWQMYCERHRKLRAEFGPLTNRQMFSQLSGIAQSIPMNVEKIAPKYTSASIQQQIPTTPSVINNLVLPANTMLSQQQHPQLIMRTVLTVPPANASSSQVITAVVTTPAVPAPTPQPVPTLTSSVPHPQNAALVQQPQHIPSLQQQSNMLSQSPPDSPGSTPPPSSSGSMQPHPDVPGSGATAGENVHFPDLSMPPPRFHSTNVPPPTFPVPGLPPTNVPPPMFGHPPPPGVPLRFPPPFGFPPPSRPRIQSIRHSYRVGFPPNFESTPRDDARSPASYSDKSSDEEDRDRYDRHRRHAPSERYRRSSRSPSSSTRSRYSGRDRDRERSSHRGSRYRSRSPLDRSHHGSSSHDDRKDSRDKRRKSEEDDSHKKTKKRKIKDEPMDEEDLMEKSREKSSKKSKEKEDKDKDRSSSSSSKKRKKSKERQDTEHHAEEDSQKT